MGIFSSHPQQYANASVLDVDTKHLSCEGLQRLEEPFAEAYEIADDKFTGGIGNVTQGASKIRHTGKLKSLVSIFRNLGKLLKRKKLRRKVRVNVDTKKPVKTELPEDKKLTPKKKPTYQHGQSDGGPGTWQK